MSQVFEGCRFQAKSNERLRVTIAYVASSSTNQTNWITTPVMTPVTDQTEKMTANSPPQPTKITSLDDNNAKTMISYPYKTGLTTTTETPSKITTAVGKNLGGK